MLEKLRRLNPWFEVPFAVLAVLAVLPMWAVDHPPIQDMPQHLAAIRVLADYGDPELAFEQYFEVDLSRTQYLTYYVAAIALSYVFGVGLANKLLVTVAIVGTPYAMRSLLRAIGRDEKLALFVFPLIWNAHLILGFLNFVSAIPLALWGLGMAARLRREWSRGRAIGLAVLAVVCFYTHVVPFAFLGLGAALLALGGGVKPTAMRWLPLVPAAAATLLWSRVSPAGQATLSAGLLGDAEGGPEPQFKSWLQVMQEVPVWLTDVLHTDTDEQVLVAWVLLASTCIVLGGGGAGRRTTYDVLSHRLARRVAMLAPVAGLLYFVTPSSYDWIWPINGRFMLLALVFLIPALPVPRRWPGLLVLGAVAVIGVVSALQVRSAFVRFEEEEVGALDEALESIPPGSRVAGLIWDRDSRYVKFSPFFHSVAWYQAERGGAVMFTFADFPHSPFTFREDARPPRVRPRWEWMPERVDPRGELAWYEYVLVRGGPGRIERQPEHYEPVYRGQRWSVWKREDGAR